MMTIFDQEKSDGLESIIKQNQSVAYTVQVQPSDRKLILPDNIEHPQLAQANSEDWDLYSFNSILASVGWNKNDDVFSSSELYKSRNTPVLKKVNFNHNEKDIIGVILASTLIDENGDLVQGENIPTKFDLAVSAVLYRRWEDETLQSRMDELIDEISKGEWYVSMECLFPAFDYALIGQNGEQKIIERSQATSFLTKHLRIYGGSGKWNDYTVGRLLRNFTFSGKGLVKKPANERSVILTKAFIANKTEKYIMDPKDVQIQQLQAELTKAEAKTEKLEEELSAKVLEAQAEEKRKLEKDLEKRNLTIEELTEAKVKLAEQLESAQSELDTVTKNLESTKKELTEAKEVIAKATELQAKTARKAKLIAGGFDEAKADEFVAKFSNLNDEQFDAIAEVAKPEKVDNESEPDLSTATEVQTLSVTTEETPEDTTNEDLFTAVASWMGECQKIKVS